jgi:YHS domain-containing protein
VASYTGREYQLAVETDRLRRMTVAIAIDPVCGMEVETDGVLLTYEYEGTTYYFCGKGCMLEFKDDPERFLAPDHQPSM